MQCAERGRDGERAIADLVDGVALRAMNAHECQAPLRCRRLGRADLPACNRIAPTAATSLGSQPNDFRTILICAGFGSSLSGQRRERRRVRAIFLPSWIGWILRELVLAPPFASTDRAHSLKISHDLRVGLRDFHSIELDLVHAPIQQIRGVRPFAGKDGEIGSTDADVAGDAFHLGRTATIKVRHSPASAVPASPPMRKPTNKAGPFTCLSRARHEQPPCQSSVALLRVEPTQRGAVTQQDPAHAWAPRSPPHLPNA